MQKSVVYEKIPEFDQHTQGVFQLPAEDRGDHIYIDVEIRELELQDDEITEDELPY